ncbi:hypothetical protein IMX26_08170 [Clostridium sp. 'deep sea']|uniref:hypothetical protein n=1 Tax=Clostridium sp. 'deep sea' TaxID=2779445 RepID=UPI0018969D7C|nr:hypothetical protein [Clostridium sp. 'deep sea']QOR36770.1 hypothetical protein IMX26_08170 [Clostridium sp. 'deep sea']
MKHTLVTIAKQLNEQSISWGIGGSLMLKYHGLVTKANDIDLIVAESDYSKVEEILNTMGQKQVVAQSKTYGTKFFSKFSVNDIEVDIMGKFIIHHEQGSYEYIFDKESITATEIVNGVKLNYTSLEDWYFLYLLMQREIKADILEEHLKHQLVNPILIKRCLNQSLPDSLKVRVSSILKY